MDVVRVITGHYDIGSDGSGVPLRHQGDISSDAAETDPGHATDPEPDWPAWQDAHALAQSRARAQADAAAGEAARHQGVIAEAEAARARAEAQAEEMAKGAIADPRLGSGGRVSDGPSGSRSGECADEPTVGRSSQSGSSVSVSAPGRGCGPSGRVGILAGRPPLSRFRPGSGPSSANGSTKEAVRSQCSRPLCRDSLPVPAVREHTNDGGAAAVILRPALRRCTSGGGAFSGSTEW